MLVQDLAELYPTEKLNSYTVTIDGDIGLSPMMVNHFLTYPIASYTYFKFMSGLSYNSLSNARLKLYYGRPQSNYMSEPGESESHLFFSCEELHEYGVKEVLKTFYYTISDTRGVSDIFPYNPLDHIENSDGFTMGEIEAHNLTTKDFAVCVELNSQAVSAYSNQITVFQGQLVQDSFDPLE